MVTAKSLVKREKKTNQRSGGRPRNKWGGDREEILKRIDYYRMEQEQTGIVTTWGEGTKEEPALGALVESPTK